MKQFSRVEHYHVTSIGQGWKPRKGCHTWDEFFAGFPSFSERFSSGTPVFPSPYNPSLPNSNTIRNARTPRKSPNCFVGNQQLFKCFCRSALCFPCPNPPIQVTKRSRKSIIKWLQTGPVLLPYFKRHLNFISQVIEFETKRTSATQKTT